ncbi:MFS transporter [Rhodococcus sp. T7]|uniref:MFS transporter n=1 Tax=Rhodococcus sp. T7 TaxID=627444 RepID=UPI00135923C8|nr:MFS transporter [Rhodococcus sp. T7]KAF0957622.1 Proline/betaine transporter [Rhodococcus sp. T7]KAF0963306.1 Proline/betaine transporter [Rhodococcus sp. T7]
MTKQDTNDEQDVVETSGARSRDMGRKAAASAFLGSMVEYYDFFLFGTAAALVFGPQFFGPLGTTGGLLASFATFGVAYVARPLGAIVFGTLGDRLGRKKALTLALNMMGLSTFLIGFLPTYSAMGMLAPALLVIMRLFQGLSAGGEQAGSNALALEHAPTGKRGVYTSWSMQGTVFGSLLASLVFVAATSLPDDLFMSWGWRLPFFLAGPLMLIALYVRSQVAETESFVHVSSANDTSTLPLVAVFRDYWKALLRVIVCNFLSVVSTTLGVYALSFATGTAGVGANQFLLAGMGGSIVCLIAQPLWARLSDRVGRRPIMSGSLLLVAALWFPYFGAIASGNVLLIAGCVAVLMLAFSGANSVQASFYAEQFPAKVRYTGMAIGMQLGILLGGFTPAIQAALAGEGTGGWVGPAAFAAVMCLVAAAGAWSARETANASLDDLDTTYEPDATSSSKVLAQTDSSATG